MLWALLPLKDFVNAKQRLAGVLAPHERRHLFQAMVEDVLTVLSAQPEIDRLLIVSDDPSAELLAERYGALCWPEAELGARGLNGVVTASARRLSEQEGVDELLVVHGDLPLLSSTELGALIAAHRRAGSARMTIAPDRHHQGSNCLLLSPPTAIDFCYGEGSLQRHREAAQRAEVDFQSLELEAIGCDIDEAEDLLCLLARQGAGDKRSIHYLQQSGIAGRLKAMLPEVVPPIGATPACERQS